MLKLMLICSTPLKLKKMMTKRIFVAAKIYPSKKIIEGINSIKTFLYDEKIKWVNPNNFHITLKFLGDTNESLIDEFNNRLSEICRTIKSDTIEIKNFGTFPQRKRPKVLWFGIENYDILNKLHKKIDENFVKLGIKSENRDFNPHLTIGRVKFLNNPQRIKKLLDYFESAFFQTQRIDEIILFESKLSKKGSTYIPLKKFSLIDETDNSNE